MLQLLLLLLMVVVLPLLSPPSPLLWLLTLPPSDADMSDGRERMTLRSDISSSVNGRGTLKWKDRIVERGAEKIMIIAISAKDLTSMYGAYDVACATRVQGSTPRVSFCTNFLFCGSMDSNSYNIFAMVFGYGPCSACSDLRPWLDVRCLRSRQSLTDHRDDCKLFPEPAQRYYSLIFSPSSVSTTRHQVLWTRHFLLLTTRSELSAIPLKRPLPKEHI